MRKKTLARGNVLRRWPWLVFILVSHATIGILVLYFARKLTLALGTHLIAPLSGCALGWIYATSWLKSIAPRTEAQFILLCSLNCLSVVVYCYIATNSLFWHDETREAMLHDVNVHNVLDVLTDIYWRSYTVITSILVCTLSAYAIEIRQSRTRRKALSH